MENYFERARHKFYDVFEHNDRNNEFFEMYCDAIRYNLHRSGIEHIDGRKIITTQRTKSSYMVLYDGWLMFIISVIINGKNIQFDTRLL